MSLAPFWLRDEIEDEQVSGKLLNEKLHAENNKGPHVALHSVRKLLDDGYNDFELTMLGT